MRYVGKRRLSLEVVLVDVGLEQLVVRLTIANRRLSLLRLPGVRLGIDVPIDYNITHQGRIVVGVVARPGAVHVVSHLLATQQRVAST